MPGPEDTHHAKKPAEHTEKPGTGHSAAWLQTTEEGHKLAADITHAAGRHDDAAFRHAMNEVINERDLMQNHKGRFRVLSDTIDHDLKMSNVYMETIAMDVKNRLMPAEDPQKKHDNQVINRERAEQYAHGKTDATHNGYLSEVDTFLAQGFSNNYDRFTAKLPWKNRGHLGFDTNLDV